MKLKNVSLLQRYYEYNYFFCFYHLFINSYLYFPNSLCRIFIYIKCIFYIFIINKDFNKGYFVE